LAYKTGVAKKPPYIQSSKKINPLQGEKHILPIWNQAKHHSQPTAASATLDRVLIRPSLGQMNSNPSSDLNKKYRIAAR
jgi:hypothetical protein